MFDLALARVVHVLSVVLWIGGVAMVTLVILPRLRSASDSSYAEFEALERRFAFQARITVPLAGFSGLYLLWRLDLWARFAEPRFWWMHAMVVLWVLFMLVLFVLEPLFEDRLREAAQRSPAPWLRRIQQLHWILLTASLLTLASAVAGSHGGF